MRAALFGAVILAAAILSANPGAMAQPGGQMAVPASPSNQTYEIPPGSKDQIVMILTRDLKPGESAGPHIHHGVEMSEVISGTMEIYRAGQKPEIVKAGGSFLIPRETPHDARNIGTDVARLSITYVIDKGSAPRNPVDASLVPYK
jgi:quercetin dioxygenase-like cupin family protein